MSDYTNTIQWDKGDDNIVVLTLDDPNQSANTMNEAYGRSMGATVERLEAEKDDIAGVILTSGKKTFFAGGDLNDLKAAKREEEQRAALSQARAELRELEIRDRHVAACLRDASLPLRFIQLERDNGLKQLNCRCPREVIRGRRPFKTLQRGLLGRIGPESVLVCGISSGP